MPLKSVAQEIRKIIEEEDVESAIQAYFLNGTVDEVRIYNRALSDEEVLTLYHNVISVLHGRL